MADARQERVHLTTCPHRRDRRRGPPGHGARDLPRDNFSLLPWTSAADLFGRCREQLVLEFSEKPRARPSVGPSARGPDARLFPDRRGNPCLTWASVSVPPTVGLWSLCAASLTWPTPRGSLPL